jgi:carboxyl-terminal processing protease
MVCLRCSCMKCGISTSRTCACVSRVALLCVLVCCLAQFCWPQEITPKERDQAQAMLKDVANDVKQNYYDPRLHGIDWDAKVREAKEKIDTADSLNRALSDIAALLDSLNDSHTSFVPPPRPYKHDYGFQMQMIGDRCYVTHVRPGSDAESKGLKAGDEILTVNGYTPTRNDFGRMVYLFWGLRPQPGLRLGLHGLDGSERQIDVMAKLRELPKVKNFNEMNIFDIHREYADEEQSLGVKYAERNAGGGNTLLIVKLPEFMAFPGEADDIVSKIRYYKAVIFDLRGDPGGSVEMCQSLLGGVFDHKVKIADRVGRSSTKSIETEHHFGPFKGKVAVLIDSKSASASEIVARVIQLEKRGVIIGDRSAGAVMEAELYFHTTTGTTGDSYLAYGSEITSADMVMTDGQSLEHRGVVPDGVVLPTAADLASGRDPALAKAAELLNIQVSPEEAGKLFPYEWPKD